MSALSERRIDVFGGAISESADKQVLPVRIRREIGRFSFSRMATELPFLNSALRRLSLGNWTWLLVLLLTCRVMSAEPVAVRHREGTIHGFLLVRMLEGTAIATGDLIQVPHGDRINSRIVFRFKDGSIDDETTVYSQNGVFRLISDHHVQRGPSFPNPIDMSIEIHRTSHGPFYRQ
jgi:hypothetical protein